MGAVQRLGLGCPGEELPWVGVRGLQSFSTGSAICTVCPWLAQG